MNELRYDPILPDRPSGVADFLQSISITIDDRPVGILRWHAPADPSDTQGVVQILTVDIIEAHRRQGLGQTMLDAAIKQAREWHARRGVKLRRMWIAVEQKHQVVARAFLTARSFHHTSTVTGVCRRQDLLVYARAFD